MGAFEFYTKMKEDRKAAWADYYKLCAAGGSMGYFDLLKYSGLHKVLEDGSVKLILKAVRVLLGENRSVFLRSAQQVRRPTEQLHEI